MLKTIMFCAVAYSVSTPAFAGEKSVATPGIKVTASRAIPVRPIPVRSTPAREVPLGRAVVSSAHARPTTTFVLPAVNRTAYDLGAPAAVRLQTGYDRPKSTPASPFALPEPQPQPAWQLTDKFSEVTARAGARYAVGDALADHRRVGPPRSAFDAMLVFRIDGSNDSPPLSVGGGVAGAMWKAGVTR